MKLRLPELWHRNLARKVNRNTLLVSVSCVMATAWSDPFEGTLMYYFDSLF